VSSYHELLSDDPAWPELEAAARDSRRVTILPRDAESARCCLERLHVTTRSTLGALAHETGGILVDHGWLRLFGCRSSFRGRVDRQLVEREQNGGAALVSRRA
jgi:hypothetical protein